MEFAEYVTILRRRWRIIVALGALGVVVGVFVPVSESASGGWQATAVLVSTTETGPQVGDVTLLAQSPAVLDAVVADLGGTDDPQALRSVVDVQVSESGTVAVTSVASDEDRARAIADAFAARISDEALSLLQQAQARDTTRLETQLDQVQQQLAAAQAEAEDEAAGPAAAAKVRGLEATLDAVSQQLASRQTSPAGVPLSLVQPAVTTPIDVETAISPPTNPVERALLFGLVGLLLGVVSALFVERLDPRLLTAGELGRAFGMPVLVTVPAMPEPSRSGIPYSAEAPESPAADAFRALRMSLLLARPRVPDSDDRGADVSQAGRHATTRPAGLEGTRVVLVTADRSGAGVTTTVANLAVAFSLSGMSVLVVDADQRRQTLSGSFGLAARVGLSDLLTRSSISPADIESAAHAPSPDLPLLRVLPAGESRTFRGADPARAEELIAAARDKAQVVLVDAAALLESVEALELAPFVDGIVVVARPGGVTRERAMQVVDAVTQLRIPVFGLVAAASRSGRVRSLRSPRAGRPTLPEAASSGSGVESLLRTAKPLPTQPDPAS